MRIVVLVAPQAEPLEPAPRHRIGLARLGVEDFQPEHTLSIAVRHGISRSFWNTMPILPRKKLNSRNGSWPVTATLPLVGSIRPASRLNMVDLPHPVLPRTATISPCAIVKREPVDRHEGRRSVRPGKHLGDLAGSE